MPALVNVCVKVCPFAIADDANELSSALTVCWVESSNFQVTVVPTGTVSGLRHPDDPAGGPGCLPGQPPGCVHAIRSAGLPVSRHTVPAAAGAVSAVPTRRGTGLAAAHRQWADDHPADGEPADGGGPLGSRGVTR